MAKKTNEVAVVPQNHNDVALTQEQQKLADMVDQLEDLDEGAELTGDYYKFRVGDKIRCWVVGVKEMPSKNPAEAGKMINAIKLLGKFQERDKEGNDVEGAEPQVKQIVTAEIVLRTTLEKQAEAVEAGEIKTPVPVVITCTGSTKTGNGTYKTFSVRQLGLAK